MGNWEKIEHQKAIKGSEHKLKQNITIKQHRSCFFGSEATSAGIISRWICASLRASLLNWSAKRMAQSERPPRRASWVSHWYFASHGCLQHNSRRQAVEQGSTASSPQGSSSVRMAPAIPPQPTLTLAPQLRHHQSQCPFCGCTGKWTKADADFPLKLLKSWHRLLLQQAGYKGARFLIKVPNIDGAMSARD